MKVGIKIGPKDSEEYVNEIRKIADFIEIYSLEGYGFEVLSNYKKPVIIHVPHMSSGVNFTNPKREEKNLSMLNWSKKMADKFKSRIMIFHPGQIENENCKIEHLEKFIKKNYDERMIIENMPYSSEGIIEFGSTAKDIKEITSKNKVGFCLDFSHASAYARRMNLDTEEFLKELISLKPRQFHLTDTNLNRVFDKGYDEEHLNLGEGNMDIALIKKLLPADAWVTVETPSNLEKQKRDIKILKE